MSVLRGMRQLEQTAAEIYKVRESYQRFDQKYNLIWQGDWNDELSDLSTARYNKRRVEMLEKGQEGFGILDWAFLRGALAPNNAAKFQINVPNKGGTSWDPMTISTWGKESMEPSLERWQEEPEETSRVIKKMSLYFGASQVGICKLDRKWVYSHYYNAEKKCSYPIKFSDEPGYENIRQPVQLEDGTQVIPKEIQYAIVFIHEMDYDAIRTSPRLTHMAATMTAYSQIGYTAMSMAEFIRGLGYNAIPSANCTALNIPLAIDAGLGELGRNAKLINPLFGPRCRISKVLTDLPLLTDKPVAFGVAHFCSICKKCATACPSRAIPAGDPSYVPIGNFSQQDVWQWQVDHRKCRGFWTKTGTNCGICITSCPYNKKSSFLHRTSVSALSLLPSLGKLFMAADNVLGYGKNMPSREFWKKKARNKNK